ECLDGYGYLVCFFFSSRRRHTRFDCDWSSDVCSSDLIVSASMIGFGRVCMKPKEGKVGSHPVRGQNALLAEVGFRRLSGGPIVGDRKSTRLNSSHSQISYAVFCLKKKKKKKNT